MGQLITDIFRTIATQEDPITIIAPGDIFSDEAHQITSAIEYQNTASGVIDESLCDLGSMGKEFAREAGGNKVLISGVIAPDGQGILLYSAVFK